MKKVIAAAVAAAFIAPAAFAVTESNVTLYGSLRGFADYVQGKHHTNNAFKVNDGGSRIGFTGADRLNSDMAVIWQIESGVDTNQGGGNWANRNSFVGLDTNAGVLRLGNFDSAYARMDTSGPQAELFDNYADSVDPKASTGFYGRANSRIKKSISYETQNLNGFIGRLSYGVDNNTHTGNDWVASASGTFSIGGFNVGAGYQYAKRHLLMAGLVKKDGKDQLFFRSGKITPIYEAEVPARDKSQDAFVDIKGIKPVTLDKTKSKAYKTSVNYQFLNGNGEKGVNVGVAWERLEDKIGKLSGGNLANQGNLKVKQDTYFVAANFPMGNWLLQAGYGWADKLKSTIKDEKERKETFKVDKSKSQMALLGTQYLLSKRTRLYGYTFWVDNQAGANFTPGYDSLGYVSTADKVTADRTGYGVSLGLRTDF
jgi:predicted porin